jgi:TPR repeat protein
MVVDLEARHHGVPGMAARLTEARKLYKQGLELLPREDHRQVGLRILRAAQLGDSSAQCHLGFLYEHGFFGLANDQEALKWYREAAHQYLPQGLFRLGTCYRQGKGVRRDWEEAARLFTLAAKMGHADAARCLADLREMGVIPATSPKATPPQAAGKGTVPERALSAISDSGTSARSR